MSINCANLTSQEYIKLKEKFGEDKANYFWNKLNGEIPEDINTLVNVQFKKAQVLMPYTIVKELKKHNIDVKNLTHQQLKDMIDSDVLEGLAYRIPNQAAASNDAFEIVGILPESVGDTIIAFKEITTKTGSDFDIDKAYVMLPNFFYNKETGRIETNKGEDKKGLQNKRLRLSNAMLSNPKKYTQLMKPLDTDWLKTLILGNEKQEPLIKGEKIVQDLNFYTGTTQAFNKAEFDNTKTLVGPIAKNMTNHNAIKHEELTYTKTYLGLGKYKTIEEEITVVENPIIETQQETISEPSGENQFTYKGKSIDTEFQLTTGQENALKQLIDFSESSDKFITLQGYAGTGKTATIGYLAKYLKDKKFLYTAPTHAATAELAFATVKTGNKEFPMTIASSVRIAKNKKTGLDEAVFTKKFSDRLNYSGNILVVDELSMLSAKDLKGLQEALKTDSSIKVIFMGDPLQIPEVDVSNPEYKQISKAFSAVKQVKLTEIKRTSNDTILNVLSNLRKNPDGSIPKTENTDKLKYLNSSEFNQLLVNTFKEEPENTVLISYTNSGVAHSNQKIREALGFTGSPKVGEVVTGYLGYSSKQVEKGNVANSIRYTISDVERKGPEYIMKFKSSKLKNLVDLEVRGVKEEAISIFLQLSTSDSFNFEDLTDKDYKKNNERISNLMERLYNAKKDALKNPKLWDNYYRIQQTVSTFFQNVNLGNTYIYNPNSKQMELYVYDLHKGIDSDLKVEKGIDYGYAITVHKSQGSTIKNVFYDTNTLPSNAGSKLLNDKEEVGTEKGSLNYVAMSRASDLLVIKADDNSLFYPAENLLKDKALAEILNEKARALAKRTITTSRKESLVSTDIDEDGNSVEETLTGYMNAIVDGVKDPYIVKGNINLFTGGVAFMLARAGVSRDWITAFMVQPILVDLVKEMNISESRISEISRDEKGETNKALDTILKLYGSQERGSEFKESLGKNNLKNEDGDIKVTFENLKDQLENPDPALQLKILKQFFEFQDVSFRLSDLMTIMSADTDGATKNDITATMRDNLFHAVINNNTFTGLEKVLGYSKKENGEIEIDDTKYIGTFHKNSVQFFKKICKEHFITSSDSFKHATYTIANYAGYSELKNKKHAEILALIEQELFASFVEESKIFSFSSMDELQLQLVGAQPQINKVNNQMYKAVQDANDILKASEGRLLNDIERTSIMKPYLAKIQALKNEKTLAQRVSEAKLKYKDNVFLQSLLVDINPYLNGKPSTIGLNSKNLNKDAKNTLYLYWEDLLNKDEKLGTDLIKYSFYTSGLSNSFGAFFEHIPTNWLVKNGLNDFMTEKLQTLNTSHTEVLHLQKQVMRHLYKDDRIVPTISDKIITEFKSSKGNVVPNQFYLTIPAFSAGSLEIGFNNEDEKEYKTYIKRSLSDETGENTKNVMYELQGYINTKDSKGENIKTLLYRVISPLGTKTRLGYVREYGNEGPSIFSENITLLPSNIRAFVDSLKKTDPKPIQILNSPIDKSFKKDDEIDENDLIFCSINI